MAKAPSSHAAKAAAKGESLERHTQCEGRAKYSKLLGGTNVLLASGTFPTICRVQCFLPCEFGEGRSDAMHGFFADFE